MSDPPPEDVAKAKRRTVLVTAIGAVIAAALLFAVVTRVSTTTSTPAGGEREARFELKGASDYARTIARDGPLLLPDPQGGTRDIFIQHLGEANWFAFEARAPGTPRQCTLRWEAQARHFVDPCDGRTYPADGAGLVGFPTTVNDDGDVVVDLGSPTPS